MTQKNLKFGIGIPQVFFDGKIDSKLISRFITRAEALNYHSLWVAERVFGPIPSVDPILSLTYAAALTQKIKIGTSILLSVLRHPVYLAKGLGSLDHLSQGRLIVGVGVGGYTQSPFYPAFGMSPEEVGDRFEEGIVLMEKLWAEEEVNFDGRFWKIKQMSINPKPLQNPRPPLLFGAHVPKALRRAARMGDGWMASSVPASLPFSEEIKLIKRYLEEEGRDPSTYSFSKRVYIAVDENKKRAEQKMKEWFGTLYKEPDLYSAAVFGSKQECIDKLSEIASLGFDLLIADSVYDDLEQVEILAKDVLPHL